MSSCLDHLLEISKEQLLRPSILPEAVAQALVSREGVYSPFLTLAVACEQEDGCAADVADALRMTAAHVNHAHLSALAWAQSIKL